MKVKPLKQIECGYDQCEVHEATHILFCTPGPFLNRILPVGPYAHGWEWNRDCVKPTLSPSIRTRDGENICHSFVRD